MNTSNSDAIASQNYQADSNPQVYDMPNHRDRRRMAKMLGLLKKRNKLPFNKYWEEIQRAQDAGKEIHRKKTEIMYRSIDEQLELIAENKRTKEIANVNPKSAMISKIFEMPEETRSYNEISADIELASWKRRFSKI